MAKLQSIFIISLVIVLSSLFVSISESVHTEINGIQMCKTFLYQNLENSSHMQMTKEIPNKEYAVVKKFKSLNCCAKGYKSIEWFKDGKPYPWQGDVSSLIVYPEAENQTIYTLSAIPEDHGVYTCVLRNDTHKTEHVIELQVRDDDFPDAPQPTYHPVKMNVNLGEPARFYCEAFVGQQTLPKSDVAWYQVFDNDVVDAAHGVQETIVREYGQVIGAYLTFNATEVNDIGQYLCRFEMGNKAHRLQMYTSMYSTPIEATVPDSNLWPILAAFVTLAILLGILILCLNRKESRRRKLCGTSQDLLANDIEMNRRSDTRLQ